MVGYLYSIGALFALFFVQLDDKKLYLLTVIKLNLATHFPK